MHARGSSSAWLNWKRHEHVDSLPPLQTNARSALQGEDQVSISNQNKIHLKTRHVSSQTKRSQSQNKTKSSSSQDQVYLKPKRAQGLHQQRWEEYAPALSWGVQECTLPTCVGKEPLGPHCLVDSDQLCLSRICARGSSRTQAGGEPALSSGEEKSVLAICVGEGSLESTGLG